MSHYQELCTPEDSAVVFIDHQPPLTSGGAHWPRPADGVCDQHSLLQTASLMDDWIDLAERRTWFLWITVCHPNSADQSAGDVVLVPAEYMDQIVIIDLHEVAQLDSWGMSIFLEAMQRITAQGGNLVLIRIQDAVRRVLKTAKLDQVFHICANRDEALAQFGQQLPKTLRLERPSCFHR